MANIDITKHIPEIALREVLQQKIDEVAGSKIYAVQQTWQQQELRLHPEIIVVDNAKNLETAVISTEHNIIYIPSDAAITQALTKAVLARNPLDKTILWEIKI